MISNGIPPERIERRILLIRGHKVMLDADCGELYAGTCPMHKGPPRGGPLHSLKADS